MLILNMKKILGKNCDGDNNEKISNARLYSIFFILSATCSDTPHQPTTMPWENRCTLTRPSFKDRIYVIKF